MKKIFENDYIIITIAEEVAKDFEYLEDFLIDYAYSFKEVETLEELEEVIQSDCLFYDYADYIKPIYYWDIKEQFLEMEETGEIEEVIEDIYFNYGGFDELIDFKNFDYMKFKQILICENISRKLYQEFSKFLEVAKIENK